MRNYTIRGGREPRTVKPTAISTNRSEAPEVRGPKPRRDYCRRCACVSRVAIRPHKSDTGACEGRNSTTSGNDSQSCLAAFLIAGSWRSSITLEKWLGDALNTAHGILQVALPGLFQSGYPHKRFRAEIAFCTNACLTVVAFNLRNVPACGFPAFLLLKVALNYNHHDSFSYQIWYKRLAWADC
jgi:hypothetical protein